MAALAPSMVDVVRSAGGWLFDRVMAGWDVTVITPDHSDSRPLQILGVRVRDLETTLARTADPVLRHLHEQLDGQPISIILTDSAGLVLTRMTNALVPDFTDINRVRERRVKCSARE